jgi:uncharacterized membrane protein
MTKRKFSIYLLILIFVVATMVAVSMKAGNWYWLVIAVAVAWILPYVLKGKVKEVVADERDNAIAGKAAKLAMIIYVLPATLIGGILYAKDNGMLSAGTALLYSACFVMFVYAILVEVYKRKADHD